MRTHDINFIRKHVSSVYFNVDKLIFHLGENEIIYRDVFDECKYVHLKDRYYSKAVDSFWGYGPIAREVFIRRCPFYFHIGNDVLFFLFNDARSKGKDIEKVYVALEELFYLYSISLEEIYSYLIKQDAQEPIKIMSLWIEYLKLSSLLEEREYFPERLLTAYNRVLEQTVIAPIIYEVDCSKSYSSDGKSYIDFSGYFPCDIYGNPIMRWINLEIRYASNVMCTCKCSEKGILRVEINPDTHIWKLGVNSDGSEYKILYYCGSRHILFDFLILRKKRVVLGLSQEEVAIAVGTSLRTYQRWETGVVEPSSFYLLRLMSCLNIHLDEMIKSDRE